MIRVIDARHSIYNHFVAELRDKHIQTDRLRFRQNLERLGEIMAYEISKTFSYSPKTIFTPINPVDVMLSGERVVVASVLRAGLPFHQGFLSYFDHSESAFISARRVYDGINGFDVCYDSIYTPSLEGKQLLLVDPMLATGTSIMIAYRELLKQGGLPAYTHIAAILASQQGLDYIAGMLKGEPVTIWVGTVDKYLTSKSYIDPGIGDVGDLAFGEKL